MATDDPMPPEAATRLADLLVRWHRPILVIALLLTAVAGWRATKLHLKTDLSELLPEKDPAVVVLRDMAKRIKGRATVIAVVESPNPDANRRYVDALVSALTNAKDPDILDVEWGVQRELAFMQRTKFLYASVPQLEDALDRIRREVVKRKNPAFVDLGGEDEPLGDKRQQIDKKEQDLLGKFPDGYYALKDRSLYAVVVRVADSLFGEHSGESIAARIAKVTRDVDPQRFDPRMTVGFTGDIISSIQERQALEDDLIMATTVCVLLVCLAIFVFYGRLRAIPFAVIPALMGVAFAFAFAELAFGYLNASTAFMCSIIVGNGINYAIVQMARFEEERRRGRNVRDSMAIALGCTWRATAVAALGAAVAYGSLAVTSFRGFNQFGYIGFVGMVLSWGMTILVLPALWVLFDRRSAGETRTRMRGFVLAGPFARFTVRYPKVLAGIGAALTLLTVVPLPRYLRDPFEYNFLKLGNEKSRFSGASKLGYKLDPIFGRSLSPNIILADDPSQVEEIRQVLRKQDEQYHVVGDIKTINDFLPGPPAVQEEKLAILAKIRTLIDQNSKLLDDKERAEVLALRPPEDLKVVLPADLPVSLRRYFTEADGTIGRPVAYYAREGISVMDGRILMKLAAVTQNVRLHDGRTVRSSGSAAVFAGMMTCILRDGPIATVVAFLGVALLVILPSRGRRGSWMVLGVLVLGVAWMMGAAALLGIRINFLNFIALPITFGIGVDYGVNLHQRYRQEGRGRVMETIAQTGGAVALASATTIIGYGALLAADNQALRSFGSLAILGEIACLSAALAVLPAVLLLIERRR